MLEEVFAHGGGAHIDKQLIIKNPACVGFFFQIFGGDRFSGPNINGVKFQDFFAGKYLVVDGGLALDDFAGGQITVFLRFNQGVFVNGLAEVFVIIGGNFGVFRRLFFGFSQLARRGSKADVNRIGIALEHFRPPSPGGTVTLVNDDDAEGVFGIMFREKACKILFFIIQTEGLIGSDMNSGVLGGVFTSFGFDNAGIVAEDGFEFVVGLFAQFITVAQKERRFGKTFRFMETP